MFSGIVQGMAQLVSIQAANPQFRSHTIRLPENLSTNLQTGASVAHNGCCLTISKINQDLCTFDLMAETLAKTNLGSLKEGDWVNVERAARFGDEIGGHVMSGHITCTVPIVKIEQDTHNCTIWFATHSDIHPYLLPKGFVGLDGCSLTIGEVNKEVFNVHLIPETRSRTLFGSRIEGDIINVEIDTQTQAIVDTVRRILTHD